MRCPHGRERELCDDCGTPTERAEARAQEEARQATRGGELAEAAAFIAELLVTYDDPAVFADVRTRARHWLREYAATRPFTH